jgi:hypothetical protein
MGEEKRDKKEKIKKILNTQRSSNYNTTDTIKKILIR